MSLLPGIMPVLHFIGYIHVLGGEALQENQVKKCIKRAVVRGAEVQTLYKAVTT